MVSRAPPTVALKSLSMLQCALLSVENSYFKWHYFVNNIHVWVHPIVKARNAFREHLDMFRTLRRYPTKFFDYLRMSIDTFDYILSNVHYSLEHPTTACTVKTEQG